LREGQITTSVHGGTGDGGNITFENPVFVVMNNGKIIAQADEGQGGDIYIKSGHFVISQNSLVSASSRLGIDGDTAGFLLLSRNPVSGRNWVSQKRFRIRG
jgi:hypothetical protein